MILPSDIQQAPRYPMAYAACLIGVAPATLARWCAGPVPWVATPTTSDGRLRYVSFLGLAEAWGVRALRQTGVPPIRLRAAIAAWRRAGGPPAAGASQRFLLGQGVTALAGMMWGPDPDCPTVLTFPLGNTVVHIDPLRRFGDPHLAGTAVAVVWERIAAGEAWDEVAADYDLPLTAVHDVMTYWPTHRRRRSPAPFRAGDVRNMTGP